MNPVHRHLLIACLAMLCGGAAYAADAPADAKKEEKADDKKDAKPEAPAEPDLPSKPYPKNPTPKAFAPRKAEEAAKAADKPADKAAEKLAEKVADKPADKAAEKAADKPAAKVAEKPADKAAEKPTEKPADVRAKLTLAEPPHDKPVMKKRRAAAAPKPVTDPALAALARETVGRSALGSPYQVKAGDNLDGVIRKTLPNSPFSMEVMREAFARANPQLLAGVKAMRLKAGTTLNVPSATVMREVILGDPAPQPERVRVAELHTTAPVVAPSMRAVDGDRNPPIAVPRQPVDMPVPVAAPEVSPEEKKRWVRYP